MAMLSNINVSKELRLCKVDDELGYFHCWEQYEEPVAPGISFNSHPGGQYSRVFGIIEFADRIERVDISAIKFVDETSAALDSYKTMQKSAKRGKKNGNK